MSRKTDVIVGAPIYRQGAYILHKFLSNQQEIQQEYPSCELVFSTNEADLAVELEQLLDSYRLIGRVITYETVKPEYARSKAWNIACGREAIRQYMLSQTEAKYYLSADVDMVYDPAVIHIMETELQGYDVVYSGYPLRDYGIGLTGPGCMMVNRASLENVGFRCVEFKNGGCIAEDCMFEMDSFQHGFKIKKGFFLYISHYRNENEALNIAPQSVGIYREVMTSALIRYLLIRGSLIAKCNIPRNLWITKATIGLFAKALVSSFLSRLSPK